MKLAVCFISIVLLVICTQYIEARSPYNSEGLLDKELCEKYALAKSNRDLRGIRDVWDKIKESAIQSWNYIKGVAEQAKLNFQKWIEDVKEYAIKINGDFKEKLEELNNKVQEIISEVYETGDLVKQCFEKEKENMESYLKTIMKNMTECLAEEIQKLPNSLPEVTFNDTKFTKDLEERVELCERDIDNVEECLCKFRADMFDNFTAVEQIILIANSDSRSLVDDIKGSLVTCSINNIIDASNFIALEAVEILNCVRELKENGDNNNEID